jgi:hypothetical protein
MKIPPPYTAYCCGIKFEQDLGEADCELYETQTEDPIYNNCGLFQVLVAPIKFISAEDAKSYVMEYDYEYRALLRYKTSDDRFVFIKQNDPYIAFSDPDEDCFLTKVSFVKVVIDGKHCLRKKETTDHAKNDQK